MHQPDFHLTHIGQPLSLAELDKEERALISRLMRRANAKPNWDDFTNFYMKTVGEFYAARGLSRTETVNTVVWKVAQDLNGRIGIAAGLAEPADYRSQLEELIRARFKTRRDFCKAAKISEEMLSHVLARRKHLSIEALTSALNRIGYCLRITPKVVGNLAELPKGKQRRRAS
jgi:hypothetical protein